MIYRIQHDSLDFYRHIIDYQNYVFGVKGHGNSYQMQLKVKTDCGENRDIRSNDGSLGDQI